MKVRALLFDLDGTLVDTVLQWEKAIAYMLAAADVSITQEEFRQTYTPTSQLSTWLKRFHIDPARSAELRQIRDTYYIDLLRRQANWFPDAHPLLGALRGRAPLGLVTGSWQTYVDAIDARLSILQYFDTVVTEDSMGGKGFPKPHPHGLLLAAERLGVPPQQCVYIGDMASDVECAHKAGMQSIIVQGTLTQKEAMERATRVFPSLSILHSVLLQEIGRNA